MNQKYNSIYIIFFLSFILLLGLFIYSGCEKSDDQAEQNIAYWTCSMHPSVQTDEPGQCPICNMDLIPVHEEDHDHSGHEEQMQQEGEIDYWTCGMHPSVRSDEPGKCPVCNMDLIPVYHQTDEPMTEEEMEMNTIQTSLRARQLAGVETAEVGVFRGGLADVLHDHLRRLAVHHHQLRAVGGRAVLGIAGIVVTAAGRLYDNAVVGRAVHPVLHHLRDRY